MSEDAPAWLRRLPLEIVYAILRFAARDALSNRNIAWATTLPLVSRAVHTQLVPILYHTVVVAQNIDRYRSLMRSPASRTMLSHVQRLYIYRWLDDHDIKLFARALTGKKIQILHAPMALVARLSESNEFSATEIHIEFAPFDTITLLGTPALSRVTHLLAFWPDDPAMEETPRFELALSLPALTHLAIRFADFDQPQLPASFDFSAVASSLRSVLQHPSLLLLVLELAGAYAHSEQDFKAKLQELHDARVFLWVNDRVIPLSWHRFRETSETDALLGVSIWDRGYVVSPSTKSTESVSGAA
ncbi:hypothetical protein AURDEDRAFT_188176 [Auricularia subglabra TFB-10046 SS5]|uniref:F-box domain-containing protein n=1 Tax=Auricularia subglabra (strain TFB-10046 / SS5) TaxID=717982 RepID=J0LH35_AURST|nr:hypothetical protein AURDEDRAFT_188176 [Auricularia subglabra TFB-10046 SS5]